MEQSGGGVSGGNCEVRFPWNGFLSFVCFVLFTTIPLANTQAEAADSALITAPSPTATCPSVNDVNYQVVPINQALIDEQKAETNAYLAEHVCSLFEEVVNSKEATAEQVQPFLKFLYKELQVTLINCKVPKGLTEKGLPPAPSTPLATAPASVGTAEISYGTAIAKLLAQRAESEMKAWLVDRVVADICDSDVKYYFPQFCTLTQPFVVGTPPSYAAMSKTLQGDLKSLPACLVMKNSPTGSQWGYPVMNLYQRIRKKYPPLFALAGLADSAYIKDSCRTGKEDSCALYLGGVATYAYLTSIKTADRTLNSAELIARAYIKMGGDKRKYALISRLTPKTSAHFKEIFSEYKRRIDALSDIVEDIESRLQKMKGLNKDEPDYQEEMLQLSFEVGQKVVDAVEAAETVIGENDGTQKSAGDDSMARIRTITATLAAVEAGRYSDAMADITKVTYCLSQKPVPERFAEACEPWDEMRKTIFPETCEAKITPQEESKTCSSARRKQEALQTITRYTPLAVNLANAKTTDDVTAALDNAASPAGAWRLKRERWMVSIGGLVGGTYGKERLDGAPSGPERGRYSALFAPVGVDISMPARSGTIGLFFSVIDVGNLMSVNWSSSQTIKVDETSNSSFRQIYSPGAYLRFGLGKSPLVFGFGIGKSPGLRNAVLADGSTVKLDSTRVSAFLAIDIPLFPLF